MAPGESFWGLFMQVCNYKTAKFCMRTEEVLLQTVRLYPLLDYEDVLLY